MSARELNVMCDGCKHPIADGGGSIWIDYGKINKYEQDASDWYERERANTEPGLRVTHSVISLLERPDAVRWNVHHAVCDPDLDAGAYSIEVYRMRTWADLAQWTAHLMTKGWLSHTDWNKLLVGAAQGLGTRISPVTPPELNF